MSNNEVNWGELEHVRRNLLEVAAEMRRAPDPKDQALAEVIEKLFSLPREKVPWDDLARVLERGRRG